MDLKKTWDTALGELEVILSKANFTTWFKDTFIYDYKDREVTIAVPSGFTKNWLSKKYHREIFEVLKNYFTDIEKVDYKVTSKTPLKLDTILFSTKNKEKIEEPGTLNPHYTFETFVVGNSNKLAHAAALSVSKKPGLAYNPLFIYGGVGLGKTHLMQAAGNEILKNNPKKRVIYASCESFTNEFIQALQNHQINKFKKKYRGVDALLIDDIQFLAGKIGTQEEFFHTFNTLREAKKQIIISSDRPPKAIPTLEKRLKSRFEWGMIADIDRPDFEMRKAILQTKAKEKNYEMPDGVISYIAENIQENIRELEGALIRLIAYLELHNLKPSVDIAKQALGGIISPKPQSLSFEKIIESVSKFYNVAIDEILGPKRNKEIVAPRQITMYLLRQELNYSFPQIAARIGKKDHTTIMYACEKITRELKSNSNLQKELSEIKQNLY